MVSNVESQTNGQEGENRECQADPDYPRNIAVWIWLVKVVYPAHDIFIVSFGRGKGSKKFGGNDILLFIMFF